MISGVGRENVSLLYPALDGATSLCALKSGQRYKKLLLFSEGLNQQMKYQGLLPGFEICTGQASDSTGKVF